MLIHLTKIYLEQSLTIKDNFDISWISSNSLERISILWTIIKMDSQITRQKCVKY